MGWRSDIEQKINTLPPELGKKVREYRRLRESSSSAWSSSGSFESQSSNVSASDGMADDAEQERQSIIAWCKNHEGEYDKDDLTAVINARIA